MGNRPFYFMEELLKQILRELKQINRRLANLEDIFESEADEEEEQPEIRLL